MLVNFIYQICILVATGKHGIWSLKPATEYYWLMELPIFAVEAAALQIDPTLNLILRVIDVTDQQPLILHVCMLLPCLCTYYSHTY